MTARHARHARRVPHVPPAVLRLGARQLGRHCLNPALPWPVQRTRLDQLTRTSLLPRGTTITEQTIAGLRAEVIAAPAAGGQPTVLHFHGGGYCVGSPFMSRSWAAHLSAQAGYRVVLPEYRLAWLDVRPDVQDSFNDWVQSASRSSVWESGCHSWYTVSGRNTNNWPDHTFLYRRRVRRFDLAAYRVMPEQAATAVTAA